VPTVMLNAPLWQVSGLFRRLGLLDAIKARIFFLGASGHFFFRSPPYCFFFSFNDDDQSHNALETNHFDIVSWLLSRFARSAFFGGSGFILGSDLEASFLRYFMLSHSG